ncbi:iron-containing alcohol dehydrogenase [Streptomyces flavotricini]|uniref:iron-containing alcohol dehydrogenase n=1 Tax=Streptomyces flavotricini TaxID=66888 RepID=UPI0035578FA8
MVKAAYSCGKPALGVGAGNVPAYVHKSAKLDRAIHDIVLSKAFGHGMVCASEQAVVLDAEIYERGLAEFRRLGAHVVSAAEKTKLEEFVFGTTACAANCAGAGLNAAVVGKSPHWIAQQAGFSVPEDTSLLLAECNEVGDGEPLTREKLSPLLAALKSSDTEHGLELAAAMVEFHGLGHSAAIHAEADALVEEFGRKVKAIRVIANSPSTFGGIGDVYNAFLPSLTLGCGPYGHNSVSDNVTAVNLINIKRIGRRGNNMQWFEVPPEIYFERNSIRHLGETTSSPTRSSPPCVRAGAALMREFRPDTIIGLGGGSLAAARKYALAHYAPTPDVAITDPVLPMGLRATVTADSGFDALTHATEAYVSAYANDHTDGLCLQAVKLIFENLERCVADGPNDPEDREKTHHAGAVAGMAFANAFLGLVHAMARTLGNTFRAAHGRANALLLPHVIRYNGTVSHEATPWPKAEVYRAPERFQEIARMLGLPAATPAEGVEPYARAVEELRAECGIPASFAPEGVDERAFLEALPAQAVNAYADQCAPANPRMPMIDDMQRLMRQAYYGNTEGAPTA